MVLKEDKERVKVLLIEAIRALCKSGLKHEGEFCVEGLLGITLNQDDVFLVNINETIRNESSSFHANSTNSMSDNDELDYSSNQYAQNFFQSNMNNTPRDKKPYGAPKSGNGSNEAVDGDDYKVKGRKHLGLKQASQSQLANAIEDIIDSANNQEMHIEVPPPKKRALEQSFTNDRPLGISLDSSNNNMFDDSDDDCDDDEEDQESIPPQQTTSKQTENCNSPVTDTGGDDDGKEEKDDEKDNNVQAHNSQMMQSWEQQQPSTSSATESDKPDNQVQASQLPRMHEIWLQQMMKMRQMSFYSNPMASIPTSPTSFEHQYRLAQQAVNLSASLGFQGQFQGHTPARSRMKPENKVKTEEGEDYTPQRVTVFKCPQCGKTYSSDRAYKDHARKHKGEYYLHCPICGKGFLCRRDLKGHMSNKHASEKEYKCHLCTKQFGYHQSYRNHMKFVHKIG